MEKTIGNKLYVRKLNFSKMVVKLMRELLVTYWFIKLLQSLPVVAGLTRTLGSEGSILPFDDEFTSWMMKLEREGHNSSSLNLETAAELYKTLYIKLKALSANITTSEGGFDRENSAMNGSSSLLTSSDHGGSGHAFDPGQDRRSDLGANDISPREVDQYIRFSFHTEVTIQPIIVLIGFFFNTVAICILKRYELIKFEIWLTIIMY